MKREDLDVRVTAAFQYELDTLISLLDARHGPAEEFRSVKKAIMIGEHGTHRWVDPPEKAAYLKLLKLTLSEYVRAECGALGDDLFDPIIAAYYAASRAKNPTKGKFKEPIKNP